MNTVTRLLICVCCVTLALGCQPAGAVESGEGEASAAAAVPAPLEILAHAPILDGVIEDDQWTVFHSFPAGDSAASISAAWDAGRLYLAADCPETASAVFYLDANADGWLAGADNFEVRTVTSTSAPQVTVLLHNALQAPAAEPSPVVLDARAAFRTEGARTVIELEIPAAPSKGLVYEDGKAIAVGAGISLASAPSKMIPAEPRAALKAIVLKDEIQPVAIEGLKLDIRMKDRKLIAGQTLSLDFHAGNTGTEPLAYSNFTIGGEPRVADLLNALRVRGGVLQPGKGIKWGFSTDLPETMPLGTFSVLGEMNLEDGRKARVVSSFDVVEPFEAALDTGSGPLVPGAERKIVVSVKNNTNGPLNGTARLVLPQSLMAGVAKDTQKFSVRSEGSTARIEFKLRRPAGSADGEQTIVAEVEVRGVSRQMEGAILLGPVQ